MIKYPMWIIFPLYMVYVHKPSGLQTGFVAPHGAPNRGEPIYIYILYIYYIYIYYIYIYILYIYILYIYIPIIKYVQIPMVDHIPTIYIYICVCVCSTELYQHDSIADSAWEVILGFEAPLIVLHTHVIYHETKNYASWWANLASFNIFSFFIS